MGEIFAGKKVFVYNNHYNILEECEITRVGRKYFYVKGGDGRETRFHLENQRQVTDYSPHKVLYWTREQRNEEVEYSRLIGILRSKFSGVGRTEVTLEQSRKIAKILDIPDSAYVVADE